MAEVPVTINGVIYPKGRSADDTPIPVTIVGSAWISGLGVGGGPMPGGPPLGFWGGVAPPYVDIGLPGQQPGVSHPIAPGGPPPKPTFPIWGPPGITFPPGSGYPPVAGHPLPPGEEKPQPIVGWEAKPVWTPDTGWAVIIVPKDETLVPTPAK